MVTGSKDPDDQDLEALIEIQCDIRSRSRGRSPGGSRVLGRARRGGECIERGGIAQVWNLDQGVLLGNDKTTRGRRVGLYVSNWRPLSMLDVYLVDGEGAHIRPALAARNAFFPFLWFGGVWGWYRLFGWHKAFSFTILFTSYVFSRPSNVLSNIIFQGVTALLSR